MKKILVLLILCGLASLAGATVDIYLTNVNGASNIYLAPSQYVTLYIWYSGDDVISFDTDVDVEGPGSITSDLGGPPFGILTATARNSEYDYVWTPGMNEGAEFEITSSADSVALGKGLVDPWATMEFHCDGYGEVTIDLIEVSLYDLNWNSIPGAIYHGITITQIPEPATMILLAAGSLLLKRKK